MKIEKIFEQEKLDGLEQAIASNNSIAFCSELEIIKSKDIKKVVYDHAKAYKNSFGANADQLDLFYFESLLASTGWNKNTDIFLASEIFKAKSTPEDKPLNLMHDQSKIIGHITSSYVLDHSGRLLDDDFEESFLPDSLNIFSSAVIYKKWTDENKQREIDAIIAEIEKSNAEDVKWYVSMECLFPSFDYGIIDSTGAQKIVFRNESTAFLTKYLRQYGGSGEYKEYKIGRVLRNLVFSGKGLVTNPANPTSFITRTVANKLFVSTASLKTLKTEKVMEDKTVSLEEFQKLEKQLADFQAKANKETETKISELETQIAALKTEASEKDSKISELSNSLSECGEKMEKMKKEKAKADRISMLVEAGLEKQVASELFSKFESVDDSAFAAIVEMQKEAVAAKYMDKSKEEEEKKKKMAEKAKAEEEAAKKALEQAKAEEDGSLGTDGTDKDANLEKAVAAVQKWFADSMKQNK